MKEFINGNKISLMHYDNNSLDILTNNGKKKKEDIAKSILMYSKIPINSHDDLIKANKRKDEYKLFVKG